MFFFKSLCCQYFLTSLSFFYFRPFHSKYTGCRWVEPKECEWKDDFDYCIARLTTVICESINTKRCKEGTFLLKSTSCSFTSFLNPSQGIKRTTDDWKQMVTRNDGKIGYWNADPHDKHRCCDKELHGTIQKGCKPLIIHSSECKFPFTFENEEYNTCQKKGGLGSTYLWCSHNTNYVDVLFEDDTQEGVDWSKCRKSDGRPLDLVDTIVPGKPDIVACQAAPTCTLGIQAAKDWVVKINQEKKNLKEMNESVILVQKTNDTGKIAQKTNATGQIALSKLNTKERFEQIPDWKCKDDERFEAFPPLSRIRKELNLTYEKNERRPTVIYNDIEWQKGENDRKVVCDWTTFRQSGCDNAYEMVEVFPDCSGISLFDCSIKKPEMVQSVKFFPQLDCIQEKGTDESYCGTRTPIMGPWDEDKPGRGPDDDVGWFSGSVEACWPVPQPGSNDEIPSLSKRDRNHRLNIKNSSGWTLTIEAQNITQLFGVKVRQGDAEGTLNTALTGDQMTTVLYIKTAANVTFVDNVDVVIEDVISEQDYFSCHSGWACGFSKFRDHYGYYGKMTLSACIAECNTDSDCVGIELEKNRCHYWKKDSCSTTSNHWKYNAIRTTCFKSRSKFRSNAKTTVVYDRITSVKKNVPCIPTTSCIVYHESPHMRHCNSGNDVIDCNKDACIPATWKPETCIASYDYFPIISQLDGKEKFKGRRKYEQCLAKYKIVQWQKKNKMELDYGYKKKNEYVTIGAGPWIQKDPGNNLW